MFSCIPSKMQFIPPDYFLRVLDTDKAAILIFSLFQVYMSLLMWIISFNILPHRTYPWLQSKFKRHCVQLQAASSFTGPWRLNVNNQAADNIVRKINRYSHCLGTSTRPRFTSATTNGVLSFSVEELFRIDEILPGTKTASLLLKKTVRLTVTATNRLLGISLAQ